jgi:hypothetical protein
VGIPNQVASSAQANTVQTTHPIKRKFSEMQFGMDVDGQQNKRPKGDEEVETEDSVTGILDKGKGFCQITQGESEATP